jgi:hypothetical protein
MRFTVDTKDFKAALDLCGLALVASVKDDSDILTTCYILHAVGDRLVVGATDRRFLAQATIPAVVDTDEPIHFAIEGYRLQQAVNCTDAEVLVFEPQAGEPFVHVYYGPDFVPYQYRDPTTFVDIDSVVGSAVDVHSYEAVNLVAMLSFCKHFIGDSAAKMAHLVTEVHGNQLQASNGAGVGVFVADYIGGHLALTREDVPKFIAFLGKVKESRVTLRETDSVYLLVTEHGDMFGTKKPTSRLVDITPDPHASREPVNLVISKAKMLAAIGIVASGMARESVRLQMQLPDGTGPCVVTLGATTAREGMKYSRTVPATRTDDVGPLSVAFDYLEFVSALALLPDEVTLGLGNRGYLKLSAVSNVGSEKEPVLECRIIIQASMK